MTKRDIRLKVNDFIEENGLITDGCTVLAAVSGGADSLCLLYVLNDFMKSGRKIEIRAVHVNHHLRDEANKDVEHVKECCESLGVPLSVYDVNVAERMESDGVSCEEAGRMLRYEAFEKETEKIGAENVLIAVAHTMNDRAETMLINMWRGSGLKGLAGIPVRRGNIIRPLLCLSRADTENYLDESGISYCIDKTNAEDDYTRNRIRHHILPKAEDSVNEQAILHMNETADQIMKADDFIEAAIRESYADCVREEYENVTPEGQDASFLKATVLYVDKNRFLSLHEYMQERLLLKCMERVCGKAKDISAVHVKALKGLFSKGRGKRLDLPYYITAERRDGYVVMYLQPDKFIGKNKPAAKKDSKICAGMADVS